MKCYSSFRISFSFLFDILKALGWEIYSRFSNEHQFEMTPDIFHAIKVRGIWNGICLYGIIILICLTVREDQYVPARATDFVLFLASLGAFAKLRKATISFVISVCLSFRPSNLLAKCKNSAATVWIFIKSDIQFFFRKSVYKIQVSLNRARISGTLHEGQWKWNDLLDQLDAKIMIY